jgi:hypothetical protein
VMPPALVCDTGAIDALVLSLAQRLQDPTASGASDLLPQQSQGRSALLRASTFTSWRNGQPQEQAIRVHHTEEGWFRAMTQTICTPTWLAHPQLARVVCLTEDTQAQLTTRLRRHWQKVAPTLRGKPADGSNLEFAVMTVEQLREGIPLTPETALLAPELLSGGPFREVFLARDLSDGSDVRAVLEAVGRARVGLHYICS